MRKIARGKGTHPLSQYQIRVGEYQRLDIAAAREVLPMVRQITHKAVLELEPVQRCLNNMVPADPRNAQVKRAYADIVKAWAGKIERLGFKVLGLWQVGFDGGTGWYGWQHPERSIRYFLEYDALFNNRCLIRDIEQMHSFSRALHK